MAATYVNTLLSGQYWTLGEGGPLGVDGTTHINYTFWQQTPSYDTYPPENTGFQPFTATMQAAVIDTSQPTLDTTPGDTADPNAGVLNFISSIANISFDHVPSPAAGDTAAESAIQIGYGMAFIDPNAEAYTYYPAVRSNNPLGGDVWANETYYTIDSGGAPDPNALHVQPGDYDWMALWHETGHALGLKHPFERPHTLSSAFDSDQYTIMSYTHSSNYGSYNIYPETFMPFDIAAIQNIYGANMSFNQFDDNYVLKPDHIYTIWDAGGSDTFDGSAQGTDEIIDLREGHYSTVNSATTMTDNIAIAYGVTIEDAVGGSGNDIIYDNGVTNIISTGDGNNTVWLTTGDDTVTGGTGNDTIHAGLGNEILDGGAGTADTIIFNTTQNNFLFDNTAGTAAYHGYTYTFIGDETFQFSDGIFNGLGPQVLSGAGTIKGGLGDDDITGTGAGAHVLYGLAGDDILRGGPAGSVDKMYGGSGNDTYYVDNSHDVCQDLVFNAAGGTDTVISTVNYTLGIGVDDLTLQGAGAVIGKGNTLDNVIIGSGLASDTLIGLAGNDTLEGGGASVDTLSGSTGADTFLFQNADIGAADVITDFSTKAGDKIDISSVLTGYSNDPLDYVHLTSTAAGTIVSIDADGLANGASFTDIAFLAKVQLTDVQALVDAGNLIA